MVKRLLLALILTGVLAVGAVAGAYLYLSAQDAEHLRRLLESSLESALDRDITLGGQLEATLSPLPALRVSDVTVGNPSWGSRPTMLSIDQVELRPRLSTLLTGNIVLERVSVRGTRLFLENSPDGRGNWQFSSRVPRGEAQLPVEIRSLEIEDLDATYWNPAIKTTREMFIRRLALAARGKQGLISLDVEGQVLEQSVKLTGHVGRFVDLMEGRPFPVNLDVSIGDTTMTVTGRIDDPDFRDYQGIQIDFRAEGRQPVVLMGWTDLDIPPLDSFELSGQLLGQARRLSLEGLRARLSSANYRLTLSGSVGHLPSLEAMDLDFEGAGDRIVAIVPWANRELTLEGEFTVKGHLAGDLANPRLDPVNLSAELPNAQLQLHGALADIPSGGVLDVQARFKGTGLAEIGELVHFSLPDLDEFDLSTHLSGPITGPRATDIDARLAEGALTATVSGSVDTLHPLKDLGLSIRLEGANFADLTDILGIDGLPRTDTTVANGVLRGSGGDLSLVLDDLQLTRNDGTRLAASGTIGALGPEARLDLAMRLSGSNLRAIDTTAAAVVPVTDSYSINGRLVGPVSSPDLEDVDARARIENSTVTVKGRFPKVLDFEQLDARIEAEGDDLSRLGEEIDQTWPASRAFRFSGRAFGDMLAPRIENLSGRLITEEIDLQFRGSVDDVMQGRGFDLDVAAEAPSVTPFLPFGGYLWDELGEARADFSVRGAADSFQVELSELAAGGSSLKGRFTYSRPGRHQAERIDGAFQDSVLDLTPWLESWETADTSTAGTAASEQASRALIFTNTPVPLGWMEDLALNVDLTAITVVFGESKIELRRGNLELADELLSVDPAQLEYLGANIDGRVNIRGGSEPRLSFESQTLDLDLGDLARRSGLSDQARGQIDLRFNIDSTGRSYRELAAAAKGHLTLLMTEGFVGDADLPLHFGEIFLDLMPWVRNDKGMTIECAMLDLPVSGGVASVGFFVLDTPDMLMRGRGTIDLAREKYDLVLVPRAKRARALAHRVDVRITGSLLSPRIRYDAAAAGLGALETAGRFAILGPAGLFVSSDNFRRQRQECAESLDAVTGMQ